MTVPAEPKLPVTSTFLPMAMTGLGSSAIGDQAGDAIAQLIAWHIATSCNCVPPEKVMSAVHTLCVTAVVLFAYGLHYWFAKRKEG